MNMPSRINTRNIAVRIISGASSNPVAQVTRPRPAPDSAAASVRPLPGDRVHFVARGETVYAIARQYGLSTRDIIDHNRLLPPYDLNVGQRVAIPGQRIHVVERGETVYAISRRYGVDMPSLVRLNGMGSPYTIYIGQRLRLPGSSGAVRQVTTQATIGGRQVSLKQTVPADADAGDRRAVDMARLPGPPESAEVSQQPAQTPPPQVASLPPSVDYGAGKPKSKPPTPARGGAIPPPPPSAGQFIWPVEGRVTASFGAKPGGLHNDGLNIAAPKGAPVRAVDNGVVAYAGDSIRGFGRMLLLKHSNGVITAYAHNNALLVQRGDIVNRGQVIARVGTSGGVPVPQLHFEVRKGAVAVDPARYLPG